MIIHTLVNSSTGKLNTRQILDDIQSIM